MTTEATQGQQPAVPSDMDASDVREVYRILGSLERGQTEIKERFDRHEEHNNQRFDRQDQRFDRHEEQISQRFDRQEEHTSQRFDRQDQRFDRHEEHNDQQFDRHEERNEQRYRETNRRIDRLWYTIVGATIAILTGIAGLALQNALMD